jgi:hypothetical protein
VRQHGRDQRASVFARRLATQVPRLAGERPLATPPAGLRSPPETIGAADLITAARYWIVRKSPLQTYRAMKHSPTAPYQLTGYGAPGAGSDAPNRAFLTYARPPLPHYIQGGEISVAILGRGSRDSVIASFAEVYTHPVRDAIEHIVGAGSTGTYSWPRVEFGKVVAHVNQPLGRRVVHRLIRNFNASPVANAPNACLGGIRLPGDVLTVRIDSDGDVWTLTYSGTSCSDLTVSRDGTQLAALSRTRPLVRILQVLEHVGASVTGRLLAVGGPPGAAATPEQGEITLSAGGHVVARAHTYGPGRFSMLAQAGRYTLSGTTASYRVNGQPGQCNASHPITIKTNHPVHLNVYCPRK